eukprot:TRINITY_DN4104_c0_g1_i1.p1 TRINITY_DN4104_c0_g1~~TRINITY_DN4104_c0_g1_i1.p1  ORF type:complete len:510 (-),score=182.22 TRINITY_DN4104_c0_g1_i1:193-1581(-)
MGSEKQHTFIETDTVRYIYQPLESLYILIITNKSSNILEDLETLHLLAKIVPEYSKVLEEKEVLKNAFDIIFAFDEAVAMGYKERVNIQQIKHFMTMESHDEIRAKEEAKEKAKQAKANMLAQKKIIEAKKKEEKKYGRSGDSYSSSSSPGSGSSYRPTSYEPVVETKRESPKEPSKPAASTSKGLQLGRGKKTTDYSQVLKEENISDTSSQRGVAPVVSEAVSSSPAHIELLEKIVVQVENDGGLQNMEVKGELNITCNDSKLAKMQVHISQGANQGFQFKLHPNMNKALFADSVLALKDASKSYSKGAPSSVLKWRWVNTDEKLMPLTVSIWPSTSGGETTVPIEFEKNCDFDLHNVVISIPIPGGGAPVVGEIVGNYEFDPKNQILRWQIPLIDSENKTGSMEFTIHQSPNNAFFPVNVAFEASRTYAALEVADVTGEDGQSAQFAQDSTLSVELYQIQ